MKNFHKLTLVIFVCSVVNLFCILCALYFTVLHIELCFIPGKWESVCTEVFDFVELFDQITLKRYNTVIQLNAVILCVGERLLLLTVMWYLCYDAR